MGRDGSGRSGRSGSSRSRSGSGSRGHSGGDGGGGHGGGGGGGGGVRSRRHEGDLFEAPWLNDCLNEARGLRRLRKIEHGVSDFLVDHLRGELDSQVREGQDQQQQQQEQQRVVPFFSSFRQSSRPSSPSWASGLFSATSRTTATIPK